MMGTLTHRNKKAVEAMLREIPEPDYKELCDLLGLPAPELRILDLKYRKGTPEGYPATREYIAEDLGISPSTLDRKLKAVLKRIAKYANRIIAGWRIAN